jgi:hypothetical protein
MHPNVIINSSIFMNIITNMSILHWILIAVEYPVPGDILGEIFKRGTIHRGKPLLGDTIS